jgi:predicted lipoprotein with Yx(FWY)xxD motif
MSPRGKWAGLALAAFLWSCGSSDDRKEPKPAEVQQIQQVPVAPEAQVVVTDLNGLTIYYYDRDQPNQSTCNGRCAEFWFPVRPAPELENQPNFSSIKRKDGTSQLAFQGRPLYTFHRDKKPGDTKGDGQQGVWHILKY